MGARMCCMSYEEYGVAVKRRDFSHDGSTASEPNSHHGSSEPIERSHVIPSAPVYSTHHLMRLGETQMSACTSAYRVKYANGYPRSSLPRVRSLNLMTIEEEPRVASHNSRRTWQARNLSRTISSDDSVASSNFGSMKNYHRFVSRQ